jgi:hypothetical protein
MNATSDDCSTFSYEVKMVYVLLNHLKEPPIGKAPPEWEIVYRNALVESHLLHTRVLTEFFLHGATRSDDIVVGDFVDGDWTPDGPELERLKVIMPEISKRMAHLTRHRRTAFPQWNPVLITGDLMNLVSQFLERIKQESPQLNPGLDHSVKARDYFLADYGDEYRRVTP